MRTNNITQHISSKAGSVVFDPTNSQAFDATTTDLQKLGDKIDAHATKPLPIASESIKGISELATLDEVLLGSNQTKLVTPYTLQQKWIRPNASDSVYGLMRYNTEAEREEAAAKIDVTVNTTGLWDILRNKSIASESKRGTIGISTLTAAKSGIDDTTAMTPAKVKAAIDTFAVTSISGASETVTGTVKNSPALVTNAALHNGFAVSPKGFIETRATQTQVGTTRMANQAEANARTATDLAISPATLPIASDAQFGITALAHSAQSGMTNRALSSHGAAAFINRYGDTMEGQLNCRGIATLNPQSNSINSLTRKDYVDGRLFAKSDKGHSHSRYTEEWTHLWQGPQNLGHIYMNRPYFDFDFLVIEAGTDGGHHINSHRFSRSQIDGMQSRYGYIGINLSPGTFWYGNFDTTGTIFYTAWENSWIWNIFGVKVRLD